MSTTPVHAPHIAPPTARAAATDGLAIASLVLSLLGFGVLGVVFGHVALRRIRTTGDAGGGLAIAGLVIGYLTLIAVALVLLLVAGGVVFAVSRP